MNIFGGRIKQEREIANLTIPELSQKTGLSESVITNIENGTQFPHIGQLEIFSKAFGKHLGYFFTDLIRTK